MSGSNGRQQQQRQESSDAVEYRRWKDAEANMTFDSRNESVEGRIRGYLREYELAYEDKNGGFHDSFEKVCMYENTKLVSAHAPRPAPSRSGGEEGQGAGAGAVKATVPGTAVFEIQIKPALCSVVGNIHGAAAALIFDMYTSMAMGTVCRKGFWDSMGVSRSLTVSYFRPIPAWETVTVVCRVMQVGKSLALITAEMRRKSDGTLLCSAEHHKADATIGSRLNKI